MTIKNFGIEVLGKTVVPTLRNLAYHRPKDILSFHPRLEHSL